MVRRKRRQRNTRTEIQGFIREMYRQGKTAAEIYREIVKPGVFDYIEDLPSKRTVEYIVNDLVVQDSTGPWSVADNDPEDASIILDILAELTLSAYRKHGFTKHEAAWVLRLRKLAPDMDGSTIWKFAQSYILAESKESKGEPSAMEALNAYFAFMPWKSQNRLENYKWAIEEGWAKSDIEVEGEVYMNEYLAALEQWGEHTPSVEKDNKEARYVKELAEAQIPTWRAEIAKMKRIEEQDPESRRKIKDEAGKVLKRHLQLTADFHKKWKETHTPRAGADVIGDARVDFGACRV